MSARGDVKWLGAAGCVDCDSSSLVRVGQVKAGEIGVPFMFFELLVDFGNLANGEAVLLSKACVNFMFEKLVDMGLGIGVVDRFNEVVVWRIVKRVNVIACVWRLWRQ